MRKLTCLLLAFALSLSSFGATVNSGAATQDVALYKASNDNYDKVFFLFPLPSVSGAITSVTLNVYLAAGTGLVSQTVSAYVSETTTWTESSSVATIDAITYLGAATDSKVITTPVGAKTFDVTGTTNGVKQGYADGKTSITVALEGGTPASVDTKDDTTLELGDDVVNSVIFTDRTGGNPPTLTITYVAAGRKKHVTIKGHGF